MLLERGRKVVTRSPHRRVGYISCPWLQEEQVEYESLLELNFARIALLCPGLVSIRSQPFSIELPDGAKYTPDFRLDFANNLAVIVEVKPSKFVLQHQEKLDVAAELLRSHGFTYLIATEEQIYKDGRDARASVYIRYARSHYADDVVRDALVKLQAQVSPGSIDKLAQYVGCPRELVLHLIGVRRLTVGPSLQTTVKLSQNPVPGPWTVDGLPPPQHLSVKYIDRARKGRKNVSIVHGLWTHFLSAS